MSNLKKITNAATDSSVAVFTTVGEVANAASTIASSLHNTTQVLQDTSAYWRDNNRRMLENKTEHSLRDMKHASLIREAELIHESQDALKSIMECVMKGFIDLDTAKALAAKAGLTIHG